MSLINRKRRFDYYKRDYSNPFFNRRESIYAAYESPWRKRLFLSFVAIIFAAIIWFLFFSKFFLIKGITVTGLSRTDPLEIEGMAWNQADEKIYHILPERNIFIFNKRELLSRLSESYYFESVSINKTLRREIVINIKEKNPMAAWLEDGNFYLIDENGKIISGVDQGKIRPDDYPLIENRGESKISNRRTGISKDGLDAINKLFGEFKARKDLQVEKYYIDKDVDTVKCVLSGGPNVYFSTKNDIAKQVAKLFTVYKDDLKSEFKSKEYLDLRYGDMIYYK